MNGKGAYRRDRLIVEDRLDPEVNRGPVLAALGRLADPGARGRMARAAIELGRPGAAARVAEWMTG